MSEVPKASRAIVSRGPHREGAWKIEDVALREIKKNELVVKMVASGICHTDLHFGDMKEGFGVYYPRIMGHEGSGIVLRVGSEVTAAKPGDPVLLSFTSCRDCAICKAGSPPHCVRFNEMNFGGRKDYLSTSNGVASEAEPSISGGFFGHSSFASVSIVDETSVCNVRGIIEKNEDLQLLSPLGCGIQTGSGTIVNVANAKREDAVAIIGMGGVGLSGIMAAKIRKCRTIIGIDKVESRLELAKELGATHVINSANFKSLDELVQKVQELTEGLGTTITMDTTGYLPLIEKGVEFTRPKGHMYQVGTAPMDAKLQIPIFLFMAAGKSYHGAVEGGATPEKYIPEIIGWWKEGKFPVEKLVRFFKAEDFEKGIEQMHTGETVKPVIIW